MLPCQYMPLCSGFASCIVFSQHFTPGIFLKWLDRCFSSMLCLEIVDVLISDVSLIRCAVVSFPLLGRCKKCGATKFFKGQKYWRPKRFELANNDRCTVAIRARNLSARANTVGSAVALFRVEWKKRVPEVLRMRLC